MDDNTIIQNFDKLINSGKLHTKQNSTINGVFAILTKFNNNCSDFLNKHSTLVRYYNEGHTPQTIYEMCDSNYKFGTKIMVKEIMKYNSPPERPATRNDRKKVILRTKNLMQSAEEARYNIDDMTVTEHLKKHMDAREDYLGEVSENCQTT